MKAKLAKMTLSIVAAFLLTAAPATALSKTPATIGYDLSYPQCGKSISFRPAFSVVGLNGGLTNTTNPCLAKQLAWAKNGFASTAQPNIQLYINTANPGELNPSSWPRDNVDPLGATTTSSYGQCDSSNSLACSYQYGWNRAVEDVAFRLPPNATAADLPSSASAYVWWLDVEKINTWQSDNQQNAADLEGMTDYLENVGARVGIYSTTAQWLQIAGTVADSSSLNGLINWRPGARNQATAKSNCSLTPLTTGGQVVMTQFLSSNQDYDYSCIK